ncbi:MAG: VWA domain-containing protein [Planctomycetota bacterium]|nr:MAG: VWA domain-containing protein [Planctomycetota bacterium]
MNMNTRPAPELSASIDSPEVSSLTSTERYLLLNVTTPPLPRENRQRLPLNLSIVIDASGSMSGARLEAAKTAVHRLIDTLEDGDMLSLVSFADEAVVHAEAVALGVEGRHRLHSVTRSLCTRGCTNLFDGWHRGVLAAAEIMDRGERRNSRVLLLSDGHANCGLLDIDAISRHASALRDRGLPTSTVGIGAAYSPTFLLALAEAGGGSLHDTDTGEDLIDVMLGELDDVRKVVVENAEIEIDLPHGVDASVLSSTDAHSVRGTLRVPLGALIEQITRRVVVRLLAPPAPEGSSLEVRARLHWNRPGIPQDHYTGEDVSVTLRSVSEAELAAAAPAPDIAAHVAELWNAWAIRYATSLNERCDFERAVSFLDGELSRFEPYARSLPHGRKLVRELHSLRRCVGRQLDPIMTKGLIKGSRDAIHGVMDKRAAMRGRNWKEWLHEDLHSG